MTFFACWIALINHHPEDKMLVKPILLCYLVDSDLSSVERCMPFE